MNPPYLEFSRDYEYGGCFLFQICALTRVQCIIVTIHIYLWPVGAGVGSDDTYELEQLPSFTKIDLEILELNLT